MVEIGTPDAVRIALEMSSTDIEMTKNVRALQNTAQVQNLDQRQLDELRAIPHLDQRAPTITPENEPPDLKAPFDTSMDDIDAATPIVDVLQKFRDEHMQSYGLNARITMVIRTSDSRVNASVSFTGNASDVEEAIEDHPVVGETTIGDLGVDFDGLTAEMLLGKTIRVPQLGSVTVTSIEFRLTTTKRGEKTPDVVGTRTFPSGGSKGPDFVTKATVPEFTATPTAHKTRTETAPTSENPKAIVVIDLSESAVPVLIPFETSISVNGFVFVVGTSSLMVETGTTSLNGREISSTRASKGDSGNAVEDAAFDALKARYFLSFSSDGVSLTPKPATK